MIRILHVVTYMGRGGLETVLMNYYRNIDRTKIQFDFLTHRDFEADYDEEIRSLGGIIHRLPRMVPWSSSYNKALDSFFTTHPEYKIVHVHQDCLSSVILRSAKNNGIPVRIAHSHNSNQDKNLKYPIKLYYRGKIPKFATDLFACSRESGDWMFRGKQYHLLNNAIEADIYSNINVDSASVRRSISVPENALLFGNIARFAPQKNHTFLIDVFNEIKKVNPNSYLLLIGDGELRGDIENKVKSMNLSGNVIFTGVREDVNILLQAMNVYIMPSVYEGLPVSLIEAQASGIPCVICNHFSKECDITQLTRRISLNASAKEWAELAVSVSDFPRTNTLDDIRKAGFDIVQNAKWLEDYYIQQWEVIK